MGTALTRIEKEFILKTLLDQRAGLEYRYKKARGSCVVFEMTAKTLVVETGDPLPETDEKSPWIDFFFDFKGTQMTFRSRILGAEDRSVTLSFPEGIYRDLARQYERVLAPDEVHVSFLLEGRRFDMDFPRSESYDLPDEDVAAPGFEPSRIADLLRAFREKVRELASENKIIMFRERKPESMEERVVARTGRILLYPQSYGGGENETMILSPRILGQEDVILAQTNEGVELFQVLHDIAESTAAKERNGILHELYCPILFQEYVAGYLYLVSAKEGGSRFTQRVIDYVSQFSRLLSYALKVNGYFKAKPVQEKVEDAELIDMSASGILISLKLAEFESLFRLYMDFDLTIAIGDREVKTPARVMRKFNDKGRLYTALHFLNMREEDKIFLLEFLYGRIESPGIYASTEDYSL